MSALLIAVGAACAASGSLITGYVLKLTESRRTIRDAGREDIVRKQRVDRYDALQNLLRGQAQLKHCVYHVLEWDDERDQHYVERGIIFV